MLESSLNHGFEQNLDALALALMVKPVDFSSVLW